MKLYNSRLYRSRLRNSLTKTRLNSALLVLIAALVVAVTFAAGKGGVATGVVLAAQFRAAAPDLPSVANSPLNSNVPNSDWSDPVRVPPTDGYDNYPIISASSINGAV